MCARRAPPRPACLPTHHICGSQLIAIHHVLVSVHLLAVSMQESVRACACVRACVRDDALIACYFAWRRYVHFSPAELAHWVLPREGVVDAYVVQQPSGKVTDFCSFYFLPSSILKHHKHTKLHAAYSYYNVATSVKLEVLMKDCLIKVGCLVGWLFGWLVCWLVGRFECMDTHFIALVRHSGLLRVVVWVGALLL